MPTTNRTIVATSMGFHRGGRAWTPGPIFDLLASLAGSPDHPRLCFLSTGTGDRAESISGFYGAFAGGTVCTSHVALFDMPNVRNVAAHLHDQHIVWVDRGSLVNLVAVWNAHGIDRVLRECWEAGVVLAGESAGSLCWHRVGTTDSFGPRVRPVAGLGLLPYANAVHYQQRRASFHGLMADTDSPSVGYATDFGVGLVYQGTEMVEAVADRPGASAYRVVRSETGDVVETVIEPRLLA